MIEKRHYDIGKLGGLLLVGLWLGGDACAKESKPNQPLQQPLVALANADPCVALGQTAVLDGRESRRPTNAICRFQWHQTSGPRVSLQEANGLKATFRPVTAGLYEFQLTLRCGSRSDSHRVGVRAVAPSGVMNGTFTKHGRQRCPEHWRLDQTWPGADVGVDLRGGSRGGPAFRIGLDPGLKAPEGQRGFVRLSQSVQLEPYRVYRLIARVRGLDVRQGYWNDKSPEFVGPSVGVDIWLGESLRNRTLNAKLQGTFDWTEIGFEFPTGGDGLRTIWLQAGNGEAGKMAASGTVWFEDVRVEPVQERVTIKGRHSVRFFRKEALDKLKPGQAQEYVDEIDAYYDMMSGLTGKGWSGKQVFFHPWTWDIWAGAWSGNPSLLSGEELEEWPPGRIREVPFQGGPIHELSHNLAVAPLWSEIPPGTLVFYTVKELNLTSGPQRGMDVVEYYHNLVRGIGQEGWDKEKRVNQNRIQDKFMMIAKQAGWDRAFGSFKQVFRMVLLAQEPGNPKARLWKPGVDFPAELYTPAFVAAMKGTMWDQFRTFFDTASRIAEFDMWSVFSPEEIEALRERLSRNELGD
jgi:hypothetical protein